MVKTAQKFVPFPELKEQIGSIERVVELLGLKLERKRDQLKGACPKGTGQLVISPNVASKKDGVPGVWCIHSGVHMAGAGDHIALYAYYKGLSQQEAALELQEHFGTTIAKGTVQSNSTVSTVCKTDAKRTDAAPSKETAAKLDQIAGYLVSEHEAVQALGIEAETAKEWGLGYAPKGTMVHRILFPVHDENGVRHAFVGLSNEKQPKWLCPNNLEPSRFLFGADKITEGGEVKLLADPLEVVLAAQAGLQAVCFLTETGTPLQAEMFAALLDRKNCEWAF